MRVFKLFIYLLYTFYKVASLIDRKSWDTDRKSWDTDRKSWDTDRKS